MDLFVVEGDVVKPTEHALLIPPYSEIWDRDTSPRKERAIMELTYIEFMCSYKKSNPFKGYSDELKAEEIKEKVFKGEDIDTSDELIQEGIELYEKLRVEASPIMQYFLSTKKAAEKMRIWLETFDMTKTNPRNGMPLYKPREITSALKDTYDVMKTLDNLEKKVNEQLFENIRTTKDKPINPFEK